MDALQAQKPADLLLVDGNSILNRAYFGIGRNQRLTAPDGTPTGAIFTFFNMLFSFQDALQPERTCVCFDRPEPTFRHELYEDYKAGRKAMDDDLAIQFPLVKEGLKYMGLNQVEKAGCEADDLIASLAKLGAEAGDHVYVLSGDRDLWQLISDQVTLIYPYKNKSGSGKDYMGPEEFQQIYGFGPEAFLDFKALMGDPSDNIPGVPGVGEKTAMALIQEYGSLDQVYAHLDEIKGAKGRNLKEGRDSAYLSYRLAKLNDQAAIPACPANLPVDKEALDQYLQRLNIQSLRPRFDLEAQEALSAQALEKEWTKLDSWQDLALNSDSKLAILPLPAGSWTLLNDQDQLVCLSLAELNFVWPQILAPGPQIFFWAGKEVLRDAGLEIPLKPYYDGEIAAYLLNVGDLGKAYPEAFLTAWQALGGEHIAFQALETLSGPDLDRELYFRLSALLKFSQLADQALADFKLTQLATDLEFPLARVLAEMERVGIGIDRASLDRLSQEMAEELAALEKRIFAYFPREINLNSSKQLGEVLFEDLGLRGGKKNKNGSYSTAAEVLDKLYYDHPTIPLILEYRELAKLRSTFVEGLSKEISEDGRIHTHFKQTLTTTGRLSSAEPNLQNIPVKSDRANAIRKLFVPKPGWTFVDADYSQIELRLLAHMSQDPGLQEAFQSNADIHLATASRIFNKPAEEISSKERRDAKTINFSIIYGISDFSLSQDLGLSVADARAYIDAYYSHYPRVKPWMEAQVDQAKKLGYVETILGRRRYIPELKSRNYHQRKFGERAAMNAPVQGSAADLIKIAMVEVEKELTAAGLRAKLILQVHDELVLEVPDEEVPEAAAILRRVMEAALPLSVPLKVDLDVGKSWGEMSPYPHFSC